MWDVTTLVWENYVWSIDVQIIFSVTRSCLHESRTKNERSHDPLHQCTSQPTSADWLKKSYVANTELLRERTQTYKGQSNISAVQIQKWQKILRYTTSIYRMKNCDGFEFESRPEFVNLYMHAVNRNLCREKLYQERSVKTLITINAFVL